jgi:hypothetical protein
MALPANENYDRRIVCISDSGVSHEAVFVPMIVLGLEEGEGPYFLLFATAVPLLQLSVAERFE